MTMPEFRSLLAQAEEAGFTAESRREIDSYLLQPGLSAAECALCRLLYSESFFDRGEWGQAVETLTPAGARLVRGGSTTDALRAGLLIVQANLKAGRFRDACEALVDVMQRFENRREFRGVVAFLQGLVAYEEGKLATAGRLLEQAAGEAPLPDFPRIQGRIHLALARVHSQTGKRAKAEACYRAALQAMKENRDSGWELRCHAYRGRHSLCVGDYVGAADDFREGRRLAREVLRSARLESLMANNEGLAYLGMGRYQAARKALLTSIGLARSHKLGLLYALGMKDMADLRRMQGRFAAAASHAAHALRSLRDHPVCISFARRVLAEVHVNRGYLQSARDEILEALRVCQASQSAEAMEERIRLLIRLLFLPGIGQAPDIAVIRLFAELKDLVAKTSLLHYIPALEGLQRKLQSEEALLPQAQSQFVAHDPFIWGEAVRRYFLLEQLGRGGYAGVFRAVDMGNHDLVALKLFPEEALTQETLARLGNEISALSQIDHPNVARIYNYSVAGGKPFMVMEYVEGETLEQWRDQVQSLRDRLLALAGIARGLRAVHAAAMAHCDVTPRNVIVESLPFAGRTLAPPRPVLIDFGISLRLAGSASGRQFAGSRLYQAPEHARRGEVSARSDVFMFGMVACELLSGQRRFQPADGDRFELNYENPLPLEFPEGLPSEIERLLLQSLHAEPEGRPALDEFIAAFDRASQAP